MKYTVLRLIHFGTPFLRRASPSQKYDAPRPLPSNDIDDLLCELLPTPIRMAVGLVRSYCQAGIEQQDSTISPRRQQATVVWRWLEGVRVFDLEELVHILERWRSSCWRSNREAQAMCLVVIVVRILTEDHHLDVGERRVTRPDTWPSVPGMLGGFKKLGADHE